MKANILTLAITLTLGVILAGSVLMPVISDAQKDMGNPVTLTNDHGTYLYNSWAGEDITFAYDAGSPSEGFTINGEVTDLTFARDQNIVIASNDFSVRTGGSSSQGARLVIVTLGETSTTSTIRSFNIEITDGQYSLTIGTGDAVTGSVDWLIYAATDGNMGISQMTDYTSFYTTDSKDVIVLGSLYVTGENDTFYSYYDGTLTVNEEYADVSSVTISKTLADGYTDIYDTSVTVTVGEETFTPFYILAPISVSGHAAAGAAYSLLGALPILVIIGLVLAGVAAIVVKRND